MKKVVILAGLMLSGCQSQLQSETIYLAKANGEAVQCGPYTAFTFTPEQENRLRRCVDDYQLAGFRRVAPPSK